MAAAWRESSDRCSSARARASCWSRMRAISSSARPVGGGNDAVTKPENRLGDHRLPWSFPLPIRSRALDRGHLIALASGRWRAPEHPSASVSGAFVVVTVRCDDLSDIPSTFDTERGTRATVGYPAIRQSGLMRGRLSALQGRRVGTPARSWLSTLLKSWALSQRRRRWRRSSRALWSS